MVRTGLEIFLPFSYSGSSFPEVGSKDRGWGEGQTALNSTGCHSVVLVIICPALNDSLPPLGGTCEFFRGFCSACLFWSRRPSSGLSHTAGILFQSAQLSGCWQNGLNPDPLVLTTWSMGFPGGSVVKYLPANAGDTGDSGSIPGLGRSSEEWNGNPFQYSCLENSMTDVPGGLQCSHLFCADAGGRGCSSAASSLSGQLPSVLQSVSARTDQWIQSKLMPTWRVDWQSLLAGIPNLYEWFFFFLQCISVLRLRGEGVGWWLVSFLRNSKGEIHLMLVVLFIFSYTFFKRFFFFVDHFLKSLYWICYNIASVLCFGFLATRHVGP